LKFDEARDLVIEFAPDVVINTAAYTAVDKAEQERDLAFAVNQAGAAAMASAAARLGVPIIHVSTDYVFSGEKLSPYVETDATGPISIYGQSKLAGELAVQENSSRYAILRTSWLYSQYGSNFVKTMIALSRQRDEVGVVADQVGCPTSASDLAVAILEVADALVKNRSASGVYHAAASGSVDWASFADVIFASMAKAGMKTPHVKRITSSEYKGAATRPSNSRLDCQKLANAFGIVFPDWHDSLDATLPKLLQ
jgi:dTDP-4-dehydrorhamnose reductase